MSLSIPVDDFSSIHLVAAGCIIGYALYSSFFRVPSVEEIERKATKSIKHIGDDAKITIWGFCNKDKHRAYEFGVTDVSPYVARVECFLRLAKLDYDKVQTQGLTENPRGKVPLANVQGVMVDDSSKIIEIIRTKFPDNVRRMDEGLTKDQLTLGFFVQQTLFGEFYYILNYGAFNTKEGRKAFVEEIQHDKNIPGLLKPLLTRFVIKSQSDNLYAAGPGRWSRAEVDAKARYTMEMLGSLLGSKSYILGTSRPTSFDSDLYAFLGRAFYDSPHCNFEWVVEGKQAYPNLVEYAERMRAILFPELAKHG